MLFCIRIRRKMQTLGVLVCAFFIGSSGFLIKVPTAVNLPEPSESVPVNLVTVQKLLLPLFEDVCEISKDPDILKSAQEFLSLLDEDFTDPEAISNFKELKSKGFLPKGEIFTEYNKSHLDELEIVYETLCNAKNFDVFFKAAAWARQNLNCGVYISALYLAVGKRRDTKMLLIPPPYEILPNYFINKDVVIQGSFIASGQELELSDNVEVEGNSYTINANYTGSFFENNDESKLAYFREDVGLNTFYYLRKLKQAPWFNNDIVNGKYGENLFQMMTQLNARYNMERYANGLPELVSYTWASVPDVPYDPTLIYTNGNEFGSRNDHLQMLDSESVGLLQTIESNIGTVVQHMIDTGYNKTQILNHLMEILVTGDRSYETLSRHLLGKDHTDIGYPSALQHYMTTVRDPMFWIINKKIVDIVYNALQYVPPYERNELYFPGVEVVNVDVKKMLTAFDFSEFDVSEALKTTEDKTTFQIKIGQPRLNHKPFTIKVNISSLISQKGVVKMYLGPKVLPGEFAKKKNMFTLLDSFETSLKPGTNIITRTSDAMKHFSNDLISLRTIHKYVQNAEFGLDAIPFKSFDFQTGYPSRLVLPKGSTEGVQLQIFVFVAPLYKGFENFSILPRAEFNKAILSPGYPLDLTIEDKQLFDLPNVFLKDIIVMHKGDSKVENYGGAGVSKKWYGTNTYDPSLKPNYSSNNEPFDYQSKKSQYGKKDYYATDSSGFKKEEPINMILDTEQREELMEGPAKRPILKLSAGLDNNYQGKSNDYRSKNVKYSYEDQNKLYSSDDTVNKKNVIRNESPQESILHEQNFQETEPPNKPILFADSSQNIVTGKNQNEFQVPGILSLPSGPITNIEDIPFDINFNKKGSDISKISKLRFFINIPKQNFTIYDYIKKLMESSQDDELYE